MPQSTMPQIKKVVFLMLENRSLDNLLGWLYEKRNPERVFPEGSSPQYDGLVAGKYTQPLGSGTYPIVPIPDEYVNERVPIWDPYEEMFRWGWPWWNGVMNQLFGDADIITGMPASGTPLTMQGFYQDYKGIAETGDFKGKDILWTYRGGAPIINLLARGFSVSDAWHCSVPTQTNPNRAYSLIGTSQGRENNQHLDAVETYVADTIFNALGTAGKSWGLYYHDLWHAPKDKPKQCFTQYTFPNLTQAPNGEIAKHDTFFARVADGSLPDFTYLEPQWGYGNNIYYVQGTDYHPPTHVMPGEAFLFQVFLALAKSKLWEETLFIVTFDEHGGTYDHVKPPQWGAINPDGITGEYGFNFDLYGVRVPTILISPFAYPMSVFRPQASSQSFDHTSFIKTLLGWAGVDLNQWNFGNRMPQAPTFDYVLADHPVNPNGGLHTTLAAPPQLASDPNEIGALFEGIPFASVRNIMRRMKTLEEIQAEIARYRSDPQAFEAELGQ